MASLVEEQNSLFEMAINSQHTKRGPIRQRVGERCIFHFALNQNDGQCHLIETKGPCKAFLTQFLTSSDGSL